MTPINVLHHGEIFFPVHWDAIETLLKRRHGQTLPSRTQRDISIVIVVGVGGQWEWNLDGFLVGWHGGRLEK